MGVSQSFTEEVRLKSRFTDIRRVNADYCLKQQFQTVGAEQRKARLAKSVLVNGLSSI